VFILKRLKVLCFDRLLQVLILRELESELVGEFINVFEPSAPAAKLTGEAAWPTMIHAKDRTNARSILEPGRGFF
jgi:hypothetical protein